MLSISSTQLHGLSVSARPPLGTGGRRISESILLSTELIHPHPQAISGTRKERHAHCPHTQILTDSLNSAWFSVLIRKASLIAAGRVGGGSYLRLCCALPLRKVNQKRYGENTKWARVARPPPLLLPKCQLSSPLSDVALHYYSTPICLILTK